MTSTSTSSLIILTDILHLRQWVDQDPSSIGFVPTMGSLHQGHLQLLRHSLSSTKRTVISIFVNPTQFGPKEDFLTYPKSLQADLDAISALSVYPNSYPIPSNFDSSSVQLAHHHDPSNLNLIPRKVDAVFLPTTQLIYPTGLSSPTIVDVLSLSNLLEGSKRPGFFKGVTTVVLKLFNLIQPTTAFFGQKDLHQALIIKRMMTDLHVQRPKRIVIVPTVRLDNNMLAMSSRNLYLTSSQQDHASALFKALNATAQHILSSSQPTSTFDELFKTFNHHLENHQPFIKLDFFSLNIPDQSFESLHIVRNQQPVAISAAILLESSSSSSQNDKSTVRLIDNVVLNVNLNQDIDPTDPTL